MLQSSTFFLACAFPCRPLNYYWLGWDGEHTGQCTNLHAIILSGAIMSIAFDIWLVMLPVYFISRLHLSRIKKAQALIMFTLGFM